MRVELPLSGTPQTEPKPVPVLLKHEQVDVPCPHCLVGGTVVEIVVGNGVKHIDMKKPRRCNACRKEFLLQTRVQLVGIKIGE